MKTKQSTKLLVLIAAGIFNVFQAEAQSALSGTAAASNGCAAVAASTTSTSVGCSAGSSGVAAGTNNTFVGDHAGFNNTYARDNVAIGVNALYSQNYTNSSTAWGTFDVAIGNYSLFSANPTTSSNGFVNVGIGYKCGYSNTTGDHNNMLGYETGFTNNGGSNNTLMGYEVDYFNTGGSNNTMYGFQAGLGAAGANHSNNSFFGYKAGWVTTSGSSNTFLGKEAGVANTTGSENVFVGLQAGQGNIAGVDNTFMGLGAGRSANASGAGDNTYIGHEAGNATTGGLGNVVVGSAAGQAIVGTNGNTCIGYGANIGNSAWANCLALGSGAVTTATNTGYIGNGAYTTTSCATGVFTVSDGRFKSNVKEDVKGLEFIMKLRPVTYNLEGKKLDEFRHKNDLEQWNKISGGLDYSGADKIIHSGFIAQEVENAGKETGYNFGGLHKPENANDNYSLSYAEFVVPLVKAVQEQQKMIEKLEAQVEKLDAGNKVLQDQLQKQPDNSAAENHTSPGAAVNLSDKNIIVLEQNVPNPFAEQTTINYSLPENVSRAQIVFYNQSGIIVKSVELTERGQKQLNVFASDLSNGVYTYSLIADGKVMETKKMIRNK